MDRKSRPPDLDEERMRTLFEEAGPRPEASAPHLDQIKAAFRAEWERSVGSPERRPGRPGWIGWGGLRGLATAAAALVVVVLGGWWIRHATTPDALARVERVEGRVELEGTERFPGERPLRPGDEIPPGPWLRAAAPGSGRTGRVALRMAGGVSLRLDAGSRARLIAPDVVELASGAVYVDSGAETGRTEVRTPFGVAREIGTQFEVRLLGHEGRGMRVRVREGRVRVEANEGSEVVAAGEELVVDERGRGEPADRACHGPDWDWVVDVAPPFDADGRTLGEFLRWVERETCWTVELASPALERVLQKEVQSNAELPLETALELFLRASNLRGELENGTLVVRRDEDSVP